jgi:hypothetical protein
MEQKVRYGDYLRFARRKMRKISYNEVVAYDAGHRRRVRLRAVDVHRLLTPYVSVRFLDQMRAVVPLALFLAAFQWFVLSAPIAKAAGVAGGLVLVMAGLMLFMEGVKHGLMPFSESIGYNMPQRSPAFAVLSVAFVLGAMATFAEPAIGALKAAGSFLAQEDSPLLYALLHEKSAYLVLAVALGVGLAVLVGILRFIKGWSLKTLIILTLVPSLSLTAWLAFQPEFAPVLGLAWDCGAITTGPVTVPLVLAIGIGVSAATSQEDNPLSGFGIVTLASLFPALAVMLLAVIVSWSGTETVAAPHLAHTPTWQEGAFFADAIAALRAILPLTLFLWLIQRGVLREKLSQPKIIAYGIVVAILGMTLFVSGLDFGLVELGTQAGGLLPTAFAKVSNLPRSPLYPYEMGIGLVLLFAALMGFGATIAEPALNAMGITVENLTDGAFRRQTLIHAVAAGVGLGTALGVAKILFDVPLAAMLLPGYLLALAMTIFSSEEYVNLAWDSAGVTTGPVTVPLVLAMGLGLGQAVHAREGFGILAMASVGPIVSVLAVGLWINFKLKLKRRNKGKDL